MPPAKIATCCYCGTRAALRLSEGQRHELQCSNCGAPLHAMKMLRTAPEPGPKTVSAPRTPKPRKERPIQDFGWSKTAKKKKKKKSLGRRALSELWDVVEDIFD